jgi:tRNA G18 (ribose-2'-O)-methylase SpoU
MMPEKENPYLLWQRNVKDELKGLSNEEIKEKLRASALPAAMLLQNIEHDLNLGTIVRSANSFGIVDIYFYGKRRFDRRSCCGTYHYMNLQFLSTLDEVRALKDRYRFVALENNIERKPQPLTGYAWPVNPMIICGEESIGITPDLLELADDVIEIESFGSVRSMNVGVAASIAMFAYSSTLHR